MLALKVDILNILTAMAYKDADSAWGHRDNMLEADRSGFITLVVPFIQYVGDNSATGNQWQVLTDFIIYQITGVSDTKVKSQLGFDHEIKPTADAIGPDEMVTVENLEYVATQQALNAANAQLKQANTALQAA